MKKIGILGMVFLILTIFCSCSNKQSSNSLVSSDPVQKEVLTEHQTNNLNKLINMYENHAWGLGPSDEEGISSWDESNPIYFVMGLLKDAGLNNQYTDKNECLSMPFEQVRKIASMFLDEILISDVDYCNYWWSNYDDIVYPELFDVTIDGDTVSALFGRFALDAEGNKQWLWPVRCIVTLCDVTQEEIPDAIKEFYKPEDFSFKIKNVENIYDFDMAQTIYTDYGYGFMFEQKTYDITSPQDILDMAERVNTGVYSETTATYFLKNDIDMSGVEFQPIGTNKPFLDCNDHRNPYRFGFWGNFNGEGHTISNLTYIGSPSSDPYSSNSYGFFSVLSYGACVFDINITNANIGYKGTTTTNVCAGILAGIIESAEIDNCFVSGMVEGICAVGGLVGSATFDVTESIIDPPCSEIINCHGNVIVKGEEELGGLVGSNHRTTTMDCSVKGVVICNRKIPQEEMPRMIGGFVGHNIWASISNCASQVEVKTMVNARCVGSFVGVNDGNIYGCFYNTDYSAWKPCGFLCRDDCENEIQGYVGKEYSIKLNDLQQDMP